MSYKIAAIDIHKRVLMVVVATTAAEVADAIGAAVEFEWRKFGAGADQRNQVVSWLQQHQVQEVGMRHARKRGVDSAVLEASMAGSGATFCEAASGPGAIEPVAQKGGRTIS